MADELKNQRKVALGRFTRNINHLTKLVDAAAPSNLVDPQYEKVKVAWEELESVHYKYLEHDDVDPDAAGVGDYLDDPGERHSTVMLAYSQYLKDKSASDERTASQKADADRLLDEERRKREARELKEVEDKKREDKVKDEFVSVSAEVTSEIGVFNRWMTGVQGRLGEASVVDKRSELTKAESEFKRVKDKFVYLSTIDTLEDISAIKTDFYDNAEAPFLESQSWLLTQLKDAPVNIKTSGGSSQIKKEAVNLPSFKGDEKCSPFLNFSIWKTQWDVLIADYDPDYRDTVLLDHLDEAARLKLIGVETDYKEAMDRLTKYYGDPLKVVKYAMKEVTVQSVIEDGDYDGMLSYGSVLENNFTRLKKIELEHEISNSQAMSTIVNKFPRSVSERWHQCLSGKTSAEKTKPFPIFIEWLNSQREVWERMSAGEAVKKRGPPRNKNFFAGGGGGDDKDPPKDPRKCFDCGKVGHISNACPDKNPKKKKEPKDRKKPTVKKHWCALHKGDGGRRCHSDNCEELRRLDPKERVRLIRENGDCSHCMGDHKPADCDRKHRICGGRKDDRGCTKSHPMHELLCVDAKVFSTIIVQQVTVSLGGVVLQVMRVLAAKRGKFCHAFFDGGSTDNFVNEKYAQQNGFKGRKEELNVTTILVEWRLT